MRVEATNINHSGEQFSAATIISSFTMNGEFISGNTPFIKKFGHEFIRLKQLVCEPDTLLKIYMH